ncbi:MULTISPECIES: glycosyltransferase [unclassified Corynebacterium]|uniref:glycosyltransferase n=1 Tax=unclassified Corynebacterium TaxID=2624378 RepID=UPI0029CA33B3|nr:MULTISPECIES: glycosyltransferase [unclassified Corynebacterium]WPF66360.1 glycosyltransferase [Corynebacterium sp. 22KM0430]WPF68850.1 glycosyltransferase [Corynebacterium sp. 21KM1197]
MPTLGVFALLYHGSVPDQVRASLESLAAQTHRADHIAIIQDGPVSPQLTQVIEEFAAEHSEATIVRLPANVGGALASAAGVEALSDDLIARLDTDDIAAPQRFEKQYAFLDRHPEIDILGTAVAEFEHSPDQVTAIRSLPERHEEIARYAKMRSPINHPSVMMRARAVHKAGNYREVHFMEDYDLFARALATGARFHNLPEPLTYFRVSAAQFQRRTSREMLAVERRMQRNLVSYGLISKPRSWFNLVARNTYRLLPPALLRRAHAWLFHRKPKAH